MKELNFDETKEFELNILKHIDEFCRANRKKYYLAYGTLIGAIRHKGFIPWDDDIDIHMFRDDYDWLIENYNKMNPNERYKLIAPNSKSSKHSFVKIIDTTTIKIEHGIDYKNDFLGVDIDIFPLDGEPDSNDEFDKWYDKLLRIYRLHLFCVLNPRVNIKRRLAVPVIRILTGGKKRLLRRAERLHKKYPYENAKYVGGVECLFINKGERFRKECFETAIEWEFEGHNFYVPVGYDEILRCVYGDYMQLPPEEERVTHHSNKVYLKD